MNNQQLRAGVRIFILAVIGCGAVVVMWRALVDSKHTATSHDWVRGLESADLEDRQLALIALEEAGTADLTDVVPALIKVTHDPNISVRSSAVMLLGQYGTRSNQGAQAVDAGVARDIARALVEVLDQDQDPGVRASAAYALSFLGASVVKTGVGPGEPAERDPLGPASLVAAFNQALERDPSSRLPLADAIERLGPVPLPAPEGLLAALEDPSINVRGKAIMALAHFTSGVDKAIPVLLADLHGNTERFPPDYVAAARQMQPSPAVVPVVLKALESDDGLLREAAEILLSRIDPLPPTAAPAVVASVRKALSVEEQGDGDRDSAEPAPPKKSGLAPRSSTRPAQPQPGSITSSLVMALAKVAPPEQSVPLLIEVSKRKAPAARAAAARALASVGPKAATAIPRLRELVNDPKAAVKDAAKLALETIDPQSHSTKKTEPSGKRP